jgi:uncharacterized lipoprotein YmbA
MAELTPEERITRLERAVAQLVRALSDRQYKPERAFHPSSLHTLGFDELAVIIAGYKGGTPHGPAQVLSAWTLNDDDDEPGDVLSKMQAEIDEMKKSQTEEPEESDAE